MRKFIDSLYRLSAFLTYKTGSWIDVLILSGVACLLMFQPYYLHGKMNLFEWGIYLPGINALLNGQMPYRDFFYLRGPLEIYVPALMMQLWGVKTSVLATFFYVGTLLTFILCITIGKHIYKSKLILYLMTLVLVARTFPRVVFTYWGGMRYAMGLGVVLSMVAFVRQSKTRYALLAGILSALALLTSIDIGVCAVFCFAVTWLFLKFSLWENPKTLNTALANFLAGNLLILLPYMFYLKSHGALIPFWDSLISVATRMDQTFPDHLVEYQPRTLLQALNAMIPDRPHFKHLTPAYCYLFLGGYLIAKARKKELKRTHAMITAIASYGFACYVLAFRKIGASQFEMALQPEKLILFFLLERFFFRITAKKKALRLKLPTSRFARGRWKPKAQIIGINTLLFLFVGSSVGYPIQRYNHRFYSFQYVVTLLTGGDTARLKPLADTPSQTLTLPRVRGMHVPASQAQNVIQLDRFIQDHVPPDEPIFMFPELGSYHFIVDRPFVGRFPMVSFSWIKDEWHEELFRDLKTQAPVYAVISKPDDIEHLKVFFQIKRNQDKFDAVHDYLQTHYTVAATTPDLLILKRRQ
jgi:hypothetical protein